MTVSQTTRDTSSPHRTMAMNFVLTTGTELGGISTVSPLTSMVSTHPTLQLHPVMASSGALSPG